MKFIKVTEINSRDKIFINVSTIIAVSRPLIVGYGGCDIEYGGYRITVTESADEVINLIKEEEML